MGTLYAVAGQRFFMSSAPVEVLDDDMVLSDFDGITWVEVKKWAQMGAIGDTAALITQPLIDRPRDVKMKGTANAGSMQNNFGLSLTDAGQLALIAASKSDLNYAFKIQGVDEPAVGSAPAASERYFVGLVMSAQEAGGAANTGQMLNSTIEINSNIVIKNPTSGAAPSNTVLPAIAGIAQQGVVLHALPGTWTGGVDSFSYVWKNEGVAIVGATSATYTPVSGDVGDNITVTVTATNAAGSASATSAETTPVIAP